jgi:hypothetical protein
MKARILLILAFWFAFIVNLSSQSTNSIASQFPGPDVATKVANAQNACYPSSGSVPCIIVIGASLSSYPTGSLPVKCANCSWLDNRSGPPSGSGAVIHAENFAGATASVLCLVDLAMPELVIPLALTRRAGTIIEALNPDVDSSAFDGVRGLVRPNTT